MPAYGQMNEHPMLPIFLIAALLLVVVLVLFLFFSRATLLVIHVQMIRLMLALGTAGTVFVSLTLLKLGHHEYIPSAAAILSFALVYLLYRFTPLITLHRGRQQRLEYTERSSPMELITFFTGMQAFAAFLTVWQAERNKPKALAAYYQAKEAAAKDPQIQDKARALALLLQEKPHLKKLFSNLLGRCEDDFEGSSRDAGVDELDGIANKYSVCRCKVLSAIRTAQAGDLTGDLLDEWVRRDCPTLLKT